MKDTGSTTNKRNQHGETPMKRYAVHLDEATAEYYRLVGGGNRSAGMRNIARLTRGMIFNSEVNNPATWDALPTVDAEPDQSSREP